MWHKVYFKIEAAEFFFREMSRDLMPPWARPESQHLAAIMASTGALVDHPWQRRFYYHLDAFLAATRSIADVIQWSFGKDTRAGSWFSALDPGERKRREDFQTSFSSHFSRFTNLSLSRARVVTFHRHGVPPVEVKIASRWGADYVGGPVTFVPSGEVIPIVAGDNPAPCGRLQSPRSPLNPLKMISS